MKFMLLDKHRYVPELSGRPDQSYVPVAVSIRFESKEEEDKFFSVSQYNMTIPKAVREAVNNNQFLNERFSGDQAEMVVYELMTAVNEAIAQAQRLRDSYSTGGLKHVPE